MRNRDENNVPNSGKIRTIKQRFYHAIDRFGEVHKSKLYIPDNSVQRSKNFDVEYNLSGELLSKCVYFPYVNDKKPSNPEISDNSPLVRIQFKYDNNRVIELKANTSGIVEETPNYKYLRYFDLEDYFSIPGDKYTELKDEFIDIKNSPLVQFEFGSCGLKICERNIANDGKLIETIEFQYTAEEYIKEITTFNNESNIIRKIIYKYNDCGLITEIKDYGLDGLILTRTEFLYCDITNALKERIKFNELGKKIDQYFFGENGKLVQHDYYNPWRNQYNKTSYYHTYHSDGKYDFCENGTFMHKKYYDANYNLLADWRHQSYTEYKYNKKNLKVERIDFKAQNGSYTDTVIDRIIYKYKYDEYENWIERVSYRNELPFEMMTREITYF